MPLRRPTPDLGETLRSLYGALAEDMSFIHCLDVAGRALRSHVSAVQHEDYDHQRSWLELTGEVSRQEVAALTTDYASRWHGQNPWVNRGLQNLLHRGYGDGDEVVTEQELFATPYYRHFLKRIDVRYGLGICIWHDGPGKLALTTFNRSRRQGAFDRDTIAFVSQLRPHLVNAYAIYMRATQLVDSNRSLRATMDAAPIGMMVLDTEGLIVETNEECDRLLSSGCGISRGMCGRLLVSHWEDRRKVTHALTELSGQSLQLTRSIACRNPATGISDGVVLHLCVVPARPQLGSTNRVVAFLTPLSQAHADNLAQTILPATLSLTPAESRLVLELRRCHDLHQVAQALDISLATARAHLQHAFAKTATRKQSELLELVERVLVAAPMLH